METIDFPTAFRALTGNDPFPWQRALYERFVRDDIPASCNLPTGMGKTSVIAVWLIARVNAPDKMPRRLVYVVNRRTVVDQTTDEVEKYRRNLAAAGITEPLAISTLRGQFADNREWSADPSRPAVICGTVDMIGSRLLFSGYGCGFKTRPLHAGFLGQDSLLVHDEAHLEPAFQELVLAIEKEQRRCNDFRPMRVMELTATSRTGGEVFGLTDSDRMNEIVQKRIKAIKRLHLVENRDSKKLAEEISEIAMRFKDSRLAILVFVRLVEDVDKITKKLPPGTFEQLTGTLRGLERDSLVKKPIFQRFLPESNRDPAVQPTEGTVYLVCTSAGEVGVNISADHLVCDLSTFESMAQRFGRVNRFGLRDDTEIHVVHPTKFDTEGKPLEAARQRTLELLRELNGDASPASLGAINAERRQQAFTPPPTILPTSDILFDAWSLTTIRDTLPGRPYVEPYLHGIAEWQPPETHVAWRQEVGIITGDLLKQYPPEDLLDDYPLKPHELLRDISTRVYDRIKRLSAPPETPVWLVDDDGSVHPTTLGAVIEAGKEVLNAKTVLLPPSAGGLRNGMLTADSTEADDVADELFDRDGNRRRLRVWDDTPVDDKLRLIRTIDIKPDADEAEDEPTGRRFWRWFELPTSGDGEGSRASQKPVTWQTHTDDVVKHTKDIIERLPLGDLRSLFVLAAKCHDLGKKRKLFQTVLGNRKYPGLFLAKSGTKSGPIDETYRHEFGSLLDIEIDQEFQSLDDDSKAFVLHVIAAHHGRGRPHFPADEAFDPEPNGRDVEAVAREVPRRFARLQRKYGRWGLAYLESLLRAADYAASANPSAFVEDES